MNQDSARLESLLEFAREMLAGRSGSLHFKETRSLTATVTPTEVMWLFDRLLMEGCPFEQLKAATGKLINVFFQSLNAFVWERPAPDHFLSLLMEENRAVEGLLGKLKEVNRKYFNAATGKQQEYLSMMKVILEKLRQYEAHYLKKENILFPYIEKHYPEYRCLSLMWSFHDDYRQSIRTLLSLTSGTPQESELSRWMGRLFFVVVPVIFREEHIVYPVVHGMIPHAAWHEMLVQTRDYGWSYINPELPPLLAELEAAGEGGLYGPANGSLSPEQLRCLLNTLPFDLTFIDDRDEVRYFSEGRERIFPRSAAVIGRKVQDCHPPASVHMVNSIIQAFRQGIRDHADFRINMNDRYILIRYFAVRDDKGSYLGTLEVSQDITDIRQLQGERRLLEWD
ncbi:MAG TPA: PAS domain-containing protein [Bacteroidales bacterium]|nr:PAS domain-containing protein [Bacteroidales bacterium]HSA42103.1 PAS domain-containing protein [Bacteroidales bacterium]